MLKDICIRDWYGRGGERFMGDQLDRSVRKWTLRGGGGASKYLLLSHGNVHVLYDCVACIDLVLLCISYDEGHWSI